MIVTVLLITIGSVTVGCTYAAYRWRYLLPLSERGRRQRRNQQTLLVGLLGAAALNAYILALARLLA